MEEILNLLKIYEEKTGFKDLQIRIYKEGFGFLYDDWDNEFFGFNDFEELKTNLQNFKIVNKNDELK